MSIYQKADALGWASFAGQHCKLHLGKEWLIAKMIHVAYGMNSSLLP